MAIYSFNIVGVHYAVNPESSIHTEDDPIMNQRTADRLRELGETRPPVVLIPEPTNAVDARAVMARVQGRRIGYVGKGQLDTIHALLQANGGRPLMARIETVEARKHGWMVVSLEASGDVGIAPQNQCDSVWKEWACMLPVLPATEPQFALMEAEVMLDDVFSKHPIDDALLQETLEQYIRLWLDNAVHDLSHEARLTREHYIMWLKELASQNATVVSRIKPLIYELEKQHTAICGQKRSKLRAGEWWNQLQQSKEMERLWKVWSARNEGNVEQSMTEIEPLLRSLPNDLYAFIDDRKLFFSRLHYSHVPREIYWQIVSLMLLWDRMQVEGGRESRPHMEGCHETRPPIDGGNELLLPRENHPPVLGEWSQEEQMLNETFTVVIPPELETPEAKKILARLQKKGLLDADYQPKGLSQAKRGVLAWELCDHLRIKNCWKVMEVLWKCNGETIRKAREKGIDMDTVMEFNKKLKNVIY